jgi:hypothetical protein
MQTPRPPSAHEYITVALVVMAIVLLALAIDYYYPT